MSDARDATGALLQVFAPDWKLRAEVEELYACYAELLDEGPLEQWPGLFVADATYRVVTRENFERDLPLALMRCDGRAAIEDRVFAIEHTTFAIPRRTRHLITGIRIVPADEVPAAQWRVMANFALFESLEQHPTTCHLAGRYCDALTRAPEGQLRFAAKLAICDSSVIPISLITPP